MQTQYTHIPDDESYTVFRESQFAHALRNRIASLEAAPDWSVQFQSIPANPDAVAIACRDQEGQVVPGTPNPSEYIFTRAAHEGYDGDSSTASVQAELERLEEFLARVKDAFRSKP
jgi:hypothetical protein